MVVQRGDIYWASLDVPRGSELGFRRPVVVVSSDAFNRSNIRTILAVVISSNTELRRAPGNVFLPCNKTGLPKDSVVNVTQIVTLDKAFLDEEPIGRLGKTTLGVLDVGLHLVLGLAC